MYGRPSRMATDETAIPRAARARAWIMDWGNALAVLLVVYCAAVITFELFAVSHQTARFIVAKLAWLPLNLGTAALALRASRRANTDPRTRRALALFAACYATLFISNT